MKLNLSFLLLLSSLTANVSALDKKEAHHYVHDLDKTTQTVLGFIQENSLATIIETIESEEIESLLKNYSPAQMVFQAEVYGSPLPTVILFYEKGEPFSEQAVAVLQDLSIEFENRLKFIKINSNALFKIAEQENIQQLPTFLIIYNKKEAERLEGLFDKEILRMHFDNFLNTISLIEQE